MAKPVREAAGAGGVCRDVVRAGRRHESIPASLAGLVHRSSVIHRETDMKLFAAVASALVVSACAGNGVVVGDAQRAAFEPGKTTEAEVVARLGPPTTVINHGGGHTLMYSEAQAQGPLLGGTDFRAGSVMLRFGLDGKLVDIISSQHASPAAAALGAMTITPLEFKP
jgi:hypothetical protein